MTTSRSLASRFAGMLCLALLLWASATGAQTLLEQIASTSSEEAPVEAKLIADTSAVRPGTSFTLGILLKLKPDWHIYWSNPGEVGYATTFQWSLPDKAMTAGPLLYPFPERFVSPGPLNSYGYSDEVLLMSEIGWDASRTAAGAPTELEFVARGKWLMCSDRCIPGKAEVSLKLPVGTPRPANEKVFSHYRRLLPGTGPGSATLKVKTVPAEGGTSVIITVTPASGLRFVAADSSPDLHGAFFYPHKVEGFEVTVPVVSPPDSVAKGSGGDVPVFTTPFTIEFQLLAEKRVQPTASQISGVLVTQVLGTDGRPEEPSAETVQLSP